MKIVFAEFVTSVASLAQLPSRRRPEIAVAGRSNVGKSSLINSLLGRRSLARVSSVPGRTQLLNFFLVNGEFYLVDLPGYGYARVPDSIRRTWGPLIEGYLAAGRDLRMVLLLIDARQGVTDKDLQMKRYLHDLSLDCLPILTKIDKLPRTARPARVRDVAGSFRLPDPGGVVPFSAKSHEGREGLLAAIGAQLEGARARPVPR